MFKVQNFKIIFLLIMLAVVSSGCIQFKTNKEGVIDLGVYKSVNKGDKWLQKVVVPTTSGRPQSLGTISVDLLVMDPTDSKTIYWGSEEGLFYTYDGANNWQTAAALGQIAINDVAVDYNSRCIIYVTSANKVYQSSDCSRSWSQIYFDNNTAIKIKSVASDHYDGRNVYLGTSRGEIIKSSDRGTSWQTIKRFDQGVEEIVISPGDSRLIFVVTSKGGIFRSFDSGNSWEDLKEKSEELKKMKDFKDLVAVKGETLLLVTISELLKSTDKGDSWTLINLITPSKEGTINAAAVNPQDTAEIYYITNTTFYRSSDGGENWTTKKLPTTGAGWRLLIDPENPRVIYMGAKRIKK